MAETIKHLRTRLKSIKNTEHITHAMELVSANKLRKTEQMVQSGRPYKEKLELLLQTLMVDQVDFQHPLMETPKGKRELLVVITSDKGFCGAFNNQIIKFAQADLEKSDRTLCDLFYIGRKGRLLSLTQPDLPVVGEYLDLNGKVSSFQAKEIFLELQKLFLAGQYAKITLCHQKSDSSKRIAPTKTQLFPFIVEEKKKVDGVTLDYFIEPREEKILQPLFADVLMTSFYLLLLEQLALEHRFRLLATNSATKSCRDLIETLSLKMNKARQSTITRELLDIVGGAEALN